jgi:hypothetical protein
MFDPSLQCWTLGPSLLCQKHHNEEPNIFCLECSSTLNQELDTKPNYVSYGSVINCWAKSRQQGATYRAEAIFRELQCYGFEKNLREGKFKNLDFRAGYSEFLLLPTLRPSSRDMPRFMMCRTLRVSYLASN